MLGALALTLLGTVSVTPAWSRPRAAPTPAPLTAQAVENVQWTEPIGPGKKGPATLRAQVLLERARFSPGEIDGAYGSNMRKAVAGFQANRSLEPTGEVDEPTWVALGADPVPILITYTITADDLAGPFVPIPDDMMEKSKLPALGYAAPAEALGEKFRASPKLLQQLNPAQSLAREGEQIVVPNVGGGELPRAARIIVDRSDSTVTLLDAAGTTIAQFPATIGSEHDPLPIGDWKILGVSRDPVFHYNPELFWDADPSHSKAEIPPGPNSPVGVVWISLSKEHYGIHGTAEPATIGKTQSHGCIRLTNWSATLVANAVAPGVPAILHE